MKMQSLSKCVASSLLVAGLGFSAVSFAANLPPIDSLLTTTIEKSVISGSIGKDANNQLIVDSNNNLNFNYSGDVFSVATGKNGQLVSLADKIGTIQGQASFPMSFAGLAMGMKAYLDGVGPMPSVPAKIDWTCNHCTLVVGDNQYISVVDAPDMFSAQAIDDMRMKGRAFTGIGPVEIGKLSAQSMSVRMAGCSAVVGVAGPDKGKMGTMCLNGTFTFDLSGINLANPMSSDIKGTGTSNCTAVMQTPLAM
jgi:hypothetical protein